MSTRGKTPGKKKRTPARIYICNFESADHLTGKKRTYAAVREAVVAAGRYSIFEATSTPANARLFMRLDRDPELEVTRLGYPWIGVKERPVPLKKRPPKAII